MLLPFLVFLLAIVMVVIVTKFYDSIVKHLRKEIECYQRKYLRKIGYFEGYGNYDLLSLDDGNTWHEIIKDDEDGSVTINRIFDPELIKHLTEAEAASQKAKSNVINKDQEARTFVAILFKSKGITVIDNPPNKKRKK